MKKSKPFVAELHDIGKLVDNQALLSAGVKLLGHTLHNFDFGQLGVNPPSSPSWWAQWSDSVKGLDATSGLPPGIDNDSKACIILTNIANTVAASVSRPWGAKGIVVEGVRLLWRPNFYDEEREKGKHWAAFRTPNDLREMFALLDNCRTPDEFLRRYEGNLELRAEDESVPFNFVPLRTHLELTGKVFRVLRQWSELVYVNGRHRLRYDGQPITTVTEGAGDRAHGNNRGKWVFRLIQCHVRFPQSLARLHDLNVLRLRRQKIEEIVAAQKGAGDLERQPYAVLFHTDDFLAVFLPKEHLLPLRQVVEPLLAEGFWLEYEELEAELNLLTSTGARTRQQLIDRYGDRGRARVRRTLELRHRSLWPDLAEAIDPPLCDLCQHRRGKLYVKDQVREWLCPVCLKIREMGEPASAISEWEKYRKPVAWLKITLSQDLVADSLQRLFSKYVDIGPGMDRVNDKAKLELKDSFRPLAAQMEFVRHYQHLLAEFRDILCAAKEYAPHKALTVLPDAILYPVPGYNELAVVRLDQPDILRAILDAFHSLLRRYFPECLPDCPVRLSVSLGNVKYPYQEHWRFFEERQLGGIVFHLQEPGVRRLQLTSQQFEALRTDLRGERMGHFLHEIADIEAKFGELTAMIRALEDSRHFRQLRDLMFRHRLSFSQILAFHLLVGAAAEEGAACD